MAESPVGLHATVENPVRCTWNLERVLAGTYRAAAGDAVWVSIRRTRHSNRDVVTVVPEATRFFDGSGRHYWKSTIAFNTCSQGGNRLPMNVRIAMKKAGRIVFAKTYTAVILREKL